MADNISSSTDSWDLLGDSDKDYVEGIAVNQNLNCGIGSRYVLNKPSDDSDCYPSSVSSERGKISILGDGNKIIKQVEGIGYCTNRNVLSLYDLKASKTRCYKHNRNEKLNFVLNVVLALEVASVFGLGTGHFLAWSHKCRCSTDEYKIVSISEDSYEVEPINKLVPGNIFSVVQPLSTGSKEGNSIFVNSPKKDGYAVRNICFGTAKGTGNLLISSESINNSAILPSASEMKPTFAKINASVLVNEYVVDLKHVSQNDKGELPSVTITLNERDSSQTVKLKENGRYVLKNLDLDFQHLNVNNVLKLIRQDFGQIIQSLSATAVAYLSKFDADIVTKDKLEFVTNMYNDFQINIEKKLSEIENFIHNPLYVKSKSNTKILRKKFLFLINSVDHFLKINLKTLKMDVLEINIEKFSKRLSKFVKHLNKNWEKIESMRINNAENVYYGSHKSLKKSEKWKKKAYLNKESRKKKYFHKSDKFSMKA